MRLATGLFRDDRTCLALIVPLALLLFSLNLGGRDLWAPDEPRSGVVARGILASGSWAVLHDNGWPYHEKPPLYFWLVALASKVVSSGRVTEFSARLPSNLAALFGIVCVFYLGRDLFGRRAGALAAIGLATTHGWFMEARWAHPDMLWAALLLFACFCFNRAHRALGDARWMAGFWLACGGATLTKGPLGLILPLLSVAVFLLATRDRAFLTRRMGLGWGIPVALLPAALWLAAYAAAAGEAFPLAASLVRVGRRFTHGIDHARPFLHLFTSLPIELLPWTIVVPAAVIWSAPRPRGRRDRDNAYLYAWIGVITAIFGLAAEKRGVYLLPLLPLLALVVGRYWDAALMRWDPSPYRRPIGAALVAGLALAAGAAAWLLPRVRRELADLQQPAALLAIAVVGTALLALTVWWRFGEGAALGALAGGAAACCVIIASVVLPALDPLKSARAFSERAREAAAGAPLAIYPHYRAAYVFYSGRTLATPQSREELEAFLRSAPRTFVLFEERRHAIERGLLGVDLEVLDRERIGHRAMLLAATPATDPALVDGTR